MSTLTLNSGAFAAAPAVTLGRTAPRLLIVTTVAATARGFLLPYARHFRRLGWHVDLLTKGGTEDAECLAAFDKVFDVEWARTPFAFENSQVPNRVRMVAANGGYDIVHTHTPVASFITRYALRRMRTQQGLRVIYTAHGFHFHPHGGRLENAAFTGLEKMAGRWTDYLVVMNRDDLEAAERKHIVPRGRVRFMPGIGVEPEIYSPSAVPSSEVEAVRAELRLRPTDCLFLMAAEFIARKRHRDALAAFAKIGASNTHLAFAGDGPLAASIAASAREMQLQERVHFLGLRRDIPTLMRAAQAVVLPSLQEGLPRCILEAQSSGVPVIGSDIRGTRDLLENGAGILYPLGDVAALSRAMRRIIDQPWEAAALARRGLEQAARHSSTRILELHEQLYEEALCTQAV